MPQFRCGFEDDLDVICDSMKIPKAGGQHFNACEICAAMCDFTPPELIHADSMSYRVYNTLRMLVYSSLHFNPELPLLPHDSCGIADLAALLAHVKSMGQLALWLRAPVRGSVRRGSTRQMSRRASLPRRLQHFGER